MDEWDIMVEEEHNYTHEPSFYMTDPLHSFIPDKSREHNWCCYCRKKYPQSTGHRQQQQHKNITLHIWMVDRGAFFLVLS